MPPQTGDAVPAGPVYTGLHNASPETMYTFLRAMMLQAIGNSVGFLLTGVALAFGISSLLLLLSKERFTSRSRHDTLLCIYIIAQLLLVTAYQTQDLLRTFAPALFFSHPLDEGRKEVTNLEILDGVLVGIMVTLSDGLLVWRCFMVQRVLGNSLSKWGNIFWIFPACLWAVTVATAFFTITPVNVGLHTRDSAFLGYITNVVLHTYATIFISIRLLLHRRMIQTYLGDTVSTTRHMRIMGTLLVLAVINLPVTMACGVGIRFGLVLGGVMLPIVVGIQVLASMLIIHQTALEKVLSRPEQSEFEMSVDLSEHGGDGSPEPAAQGEGVNAPTKSGATRLDIN